MVVFIIHLAAKSIRKPIALIRRRMHDNYLRVLIPHFQIKLQKTGDLAEPNSMIFNVFYYYYYYQTAPTGT